MIFRTSVSGHETYIPKDYTHPTKTPRQFHADVKKLLAEMPVEEINVHTYDNGEVFHGFITGGDIQDYLDVGLGKLGYVKAEITEIDLYGECLYDAMKEFPNIVPRDIARRIVKCNKLIRKSLDKIDVPCL